jgi:hypothetical protein
MPFPPSFDHPWDITSPPDTQLANLLGQDIRNLKDDTMQRISLLSGTAANKPTPETVNATWGGAGYGLLFFETDTNKIWQWSGSIWVDISGSIGLARLPTFTGVFQNPSGAVIIPIWRAAFSCTCVHFYASADQTGSAVNATKNGVGIFSALTITAANSWNDGGPTSLSFAVGDSLGLAINSVVNSPTYIAIQVNFTRP